MYTFLTRSLCKLHLIYLRTVCTHQYVTVLHFLHFDLLHVMMMLRTSLSLFLAQRRRLYLGDAPQSLKINKGKLDDRQVSSLTT